MYLTEELTSELREHIEEMMFYYSYNPNGSDYSCAICNRSAPVKGPIPHKDNCFGKKLLAWMDAHPPLD